MEVSDPVYRLDVLDLASKGEVSDQKQSVDPVLEKVFDRVCEVGVSGLVWVVEAFDQVWVVGISDLTQSVEV